MSHRLGSGSLNVAVALLSVLFAGVCVAPLHAQPTDRLADEQLNIASEAEAIDLHWSGHRVQAQMIQREEHQLIVYYDASRQMSVAHRPDQRTPWRYHKLASFVGWDSHNYATIDVDSEGHIHVMGNMHNDPLVYFRSTEPWNVRSLEKVDYMIDPERDRSVTYPNFMHDAAGNLIAIYRLGGSGNGRYYYHRYDTDTQSWSLMHDGKFFDGEDERGAYYIGPQPGPDGKFHMVWVWRETPSAATNNNLSYVRSPDLVNWEDSNGTPVSLPIIRSTGEIVDPIPPFGGVLNGQKKLGFDPAGLPMISYYKNDANGDTQIMLARKKGKGWAIHQISDWTGSKQFLDRGGSLDVSILVPDPPHIADDGTIRVRAKRDGNEIEFTVDAATNRTLAIGSYKSVPDVIGTFQQNQALTQYVRKAQGVPDDSPYDYYLSWEANPPAQDQARADIPPPSTLRLHKIPR